MIDALQPLLAEPVSSTNETVLPPTRVTGIDDEDEDFGEGLLLAETPPRHVMVLPPEAPARAAHALAKHFRAGTLPTGHLDTLAPFGPAAQRRADEMPADGFFPPASARRG